MHPAFSVIFLTTLIGAAQGLFLTLYGTELVGLGGLSQADSTRFLVNSSVVALVLSALGLVASFFHLGRPERAWRSAAMWRTSWLSREVIALPLFMLGVSFMPCHTLWVGATRKWSALRPRWLAWCSSCARR